MVFQHLKNEKRTIIIYHVAYERLNTLNPNNAGQQIVFDTVMEAVKNPSPNKRFFLSKVQD